MLGSYRAGEINFYEELGVAPGATPEEIRDAFRALARLLHPDQHTDLQLKRVAEAQMRKLNRIYGVLSDPLKRREYDEFLEEEYPPAIPEERSFISPLMRQRAARAAWAAAILCGLGSLIWFTTESAPGPQNRVREPNPAAPAVAASSSAPASTSGDQASLIASLRSDLKARTLERDAAVHELGRLRSSASGPQSAGAEGPETTEVRLPALAMTELPSLAKSPVLPALPAPRIDKPATHKLAGFWFYAKPTLGQHNKNQALYPPEYIEATISEDKGMLYGKYRARFEIVDRAISPDVNFTFTGTSTPGVQTTIPWVGAGGAKGELTLRLVSENSLRIDWNATELGTQQGLNSGTAVLTRRIE